MRRHAFFEAALSWVPGSRFARPGKTASGPIALQGFSVMPFYTYMLASRRYGTLYIGITNDLGRRVYEHKTKAIPGFTSRYDVHRLVWYEVYDGVVDAIAREKMLKKWRRDWKIRLIEEDNPNWLDLYNLLAQ